MTDRGASDRVGDQPIRSIDWDELISIDGDLAVRGAAALMAANDVGAVVVHRPGVAPGVLSERDIARAVGADVDLDATTAGDLAEPRLVAVDVTDSIGTAIDRLLDERIRHIAVIDGDEVVTLLSIRDLLAAAVAAWPAPSGS